MQWHAQSCSGGPGTRSHQGTPQASGRSPRAAVRVSDSVSSLLKRALDKVRLLQQHTCTAVKGNAVSTRKRCPFSPRLSLPCGFLGKDSGRGRQRGRPCWGGGLAAGVRGQGSGLGSLMAATNLCNRGFPGDSVERSCLSSRDRCGFSPWVGKIPWRKKWQAAPVFLPGESPWTEEP